MMREKKTLCRLLPALTLVLVSWGAAAGEPGPVYQGVLPGDAIVHLKTTGLEQTLSNLENFVMQALQGTPFAMRLQPGMLKQLLQANLAMLQAGELLDLQRPAHLLVCASPGGKGEPPTALLLPVAGARQKIGLLKQAKQGGVALLQEPEPGVYQLKLPGAAGKVFSLCLCGDDYVAVSDKPAWSRHVADVAQPLLTAGKKPGSASLVVTVDVGKVMALNQEKIEQGLEQLNREMQRKADAGKGMAAAPAFAKNYMQLLPPLLRKLAGFGGEIKSMRSYLYLSAGDLHASTYVTPKANTDFARFTAAYAKEQPGYQDFKYLPADAVLVEAINQNAEAYKVVMPFLKQVLRDFVGVIDPQVGDEFAALSDLFLKVGTGQGVIAFIPDKAGGDAHPGQAMVMYYRVGDGDAYRQFIGRMLKAMERFLGGVYKQLPTRMPIKVAFRLQENAATVEGVPVNRVIIDLKGNENDPNLQAVGGAQVVERIKQFMQAWQQSFCVLDNTLISVTGPNAERHLGAAVKSLREKRARLGKDQGLMREIDAEKYKQMVFASMRLIDFLQLAINKALAMNSMVPAPVREIIAGLPGSTVRMRMSCGVKPGKPGAAGTPAASLRLGIHIPTAALSEVARAGMSAYTQFMMLKANAAPVPGQATPPPPQAEDKPVEAF